MNEYIQVLIDGFTYDGQTLNIVINYVLIFICLLPFLKLKQHWSNVFRKYWVSILLIMTALQIYFWFAANFAGLSLVWSALAGLNILILFWIIRDTTEEIIVVKKLMLLSLLCVLFADTYYWFVDPSLTTIAHLSATFLGMIITGIIALVSTINLNKKQSVI